MNNWWIVIIACIIVFVVSLIAYFIIKNKTYNDPIWLALVSVMGGVTAFILGITVSFTEVGTKKEFYMWQQKYEYIMEVVDTMNSYDYANFGITSTILEYNAWLENAKASKTVFGNWSFYRNLPVEELEYIGVTKKENKENE